MKVDIIATEFPCPSETFAGNDVRALVAQGTDVHVRNLRWPIKEQAQYLADWGLASLSVSHLSVKTFLLSIIQLVRHPLLHFYLLQWMLICGFKKPTHVLKSLLLIPRTVEIFTEIAERKTDVVHIFWGHYPSMVGALVQKFLPTTKVTIFLGSYDLVLKYPGSRHVANKAHAVFTHAEVNREEIKQLGVRNPNQIVVYRGIDRQRFSKKIDDKQKFSIVSAGRLIPEKGFDACIEIIHKLHSQWPEIHLTIAGEGPFEQQLKEKISELNLTDHVSLLGHLSHVQLFELMRKQQIMLFMSWLDAERLPNVVKEAMLTGTICVATDTPGIDELIDNGKSGFIVKQHDVMNAAKCIDSIFSGAVDESAYIEHAQQILENRFDLDKNMTQYIDSWASKPMTENP
ncbi:MAG: glycosyltransferase [Pseudomonadales bacterium]